MVATTIRVQLVYGFRTQELQKLVEFRVRAFASQELCVYAIFWDTVWITPKGNVCVDAATLFEFVASPCHYDFAEPAVLVFNDVLFVEFLATHVCDDGDNNVIDWRVGAILGQRIVGSIADA